MKTDVVGNINYSCDDMVLLFDGKTDKVELFVNDIFGLQKSLDYIRDQTRRAKKKKLAQYTWDIDIGDLFSEDMCLYNNLSRVQPKVDSSYKFMYDYF